jgi:hypothetical protein
MDIRAGYRQCAFLAAFPTPDGIAHADSLKSSAAVLAWTALRYRREQTFAEDHVTLIVENESFLAPITKNDGLGLGRRTLCRGGLGVIVRLAPVVG